MAEDEGSRETPDWDALFEIALAQASESKYSLRGREVRYEEPTEPVAEKDWEVLRDSRFSASSDRQS